RPGGGRVREVVGGGGQVAVVAAERQRDGRPGDARLAGVLHPVPVHVVPHPVADRAVAAVAEVHVRAVLTGGQRGGGRVRGGKPVEVVGLGEEVRQAGGQHVHPERAGR